ncbi:hypothetical protein M1M90_01705 [Thermodesulfovibrionales bacterium]|nr:hypothetical protein [Thermodesulfovibrionales bacterium]
MRLLRADALAMTKRGVVRLLHLARNLQDCFGLTPAMTERVVIARSRVDSPPVIVRRRSRRSNLKNRLATSSAIS